MSTAEPVITETFEVRFRYYRYNTGAADNGTYSLVKKDIPSAEEAMYWAFRINEAAAKRLDDEEIRDLEDGFLPAPGYFIEASAARVVTQTYALEPANVPAISPKT